ncbi:MAG: hypothetical protein JXR94_12755 [Candidatus Hydrogenedentes bacterium]|nr:hypothetical protein [Candidatus Hydrogenedentota bacterium]
MKRSNSMVRVAALILAALWLAPAVAGAQEAAAPAAGAEGPSAEAGGQDAAPPGEGAPAEGASAEGASGEGAAKEAAPAEKEKPKTVAVNLNNVNIDQIVKFLTDVTGKFVVKQKDVKAQISVFSPEEVPPEKAFALIAEALLLEKIAVVEDKDTIRLVPVEMLSEVVMELQPGTLEDVTAGIVKVSIPVRFADVAELEALVKPLLSKSGSLLAHPASKQLIVTDTANRVSNIRDIVAQLDQLDTKDREFELFVLKHADAEELAPIVKSVLSILMGKAAEGGGGPPGQPSGPPGKGGGSGELDVVPYKTANWLVVVAPKEILEAAKPLIEDLDRERPQDLQLRTVQIHYAEPQEVAEQLRPLFQKRPDKRTQDTVEITAHDRSSCLVVLGSEENFKLIEEIVAELDTEESVQTSTKTYELEYADADDIAEQMNDLYSGMQQTSYRSYYFYPPSRDRGERTRFVPERRTNSVIAIAPPTEFTKIDEMIAKLDRPIDADQVAPRIYRMKFIDATEATEVLNEIFGTGSSKSGGYYDYWWDRYNEGDEEVGRLYGKVRFVPETTTNSIIVTTNNKENFRVIEDFLVQLDDSSPDAANTMVVRLENAKAEDIAEQLNALFAVEGARAPKQTGEEEEQPIYYSWMLTSQGKKKDERAISNLIGKVRVVPDKRTNSLTITTAVQYFELLRELIAELDTESPKVLVHVRLIEVTTTKVSRVGTRYSSDASVFETDDFDNGLKSTFGVTWEDTYENGTINADAGLDVSLLVQFLRRHVDARILSEPTLVMNNNEAGNIFVGSEVPFITNSLNTSEGGVNQSFEYRDAGTRLTITPNINERDKVVMNVNLVSSQVRPGEVLFGGYILDTRTFETELALKSGDTIVIGGIMREEESKIIRGFPILSRIPLVNLVFRKKDTKRETTELIAFITPTVLRDAESDAVATREVAEQARIVRDWKPLDDIIRDVDAAEPEQPAEPDE